MDPFILQSHSNQRDARDAAPGRCTYPRREAGATRDDPLSSSRKDKCNIFIDVSMNKDN